MKKVSNIVFDYFPAHNKLIGLLSIPHAGEILPKEFLEYLTNDKEAIYQDVDYGVDRLIDIEKLNLAGIAVMIAHVHRVCVDLNRPKELAILNWKENTYGIKLVIKEPKKDVREELLQRYYRPYYEHLEKTIKEISETEIVPVIDLHSMPSTPTAYHLKLNPAQGLARPDFCISDLEGKSCDLSYIDFVVSSLKSFAFSPTKNDPYKGGYLTQYIDTLNTNVIQIETKRGLYMDEVKREFIPSSDKVKNALTFTIIETMKKFKV